MDVESEKLEQRIRRFKERLKQAGVRLTHQRLAVFIEVAKTQDHPDAETVYRRVLATVPTISLDTVYRTLWRLFDLGLVRALDPPRKRVRFDANTEPHHHFVCRKCGRTRDFCDSRFDRLEVSEAVRALGKVEAAHVELAGLCVRCLQENEYDKNDVAKGGNP